MAAARRDPDAVVLEGVHALKHATRFGADVEVVATPDRAAVDTLLATLAPDVALPAGRTVELPDGTWRGLVARELPSPVLALARRPTVGAADVLAAPGTVVVVDRPRHLGNLGAVVRVAAAADAGGVLVVGDADPWHPTSVRASAGLGFALPVARCDALPGTDRPLVALDPGGEDLRGRLPADALLLVGTERSGLAPELLARAHHRWRLPMRAGVSSLNLATAVAAALYAGR
ncbi:rRNA methyltransferase [Nitriliruptoraceae bacterium ZYF776]|nr:rRNA methyltransferase [Profundirhabdus halotolerans]